MARNYQTNWPQVDRYVAQLSRPAKYALDIVNSAEYAVHLHFREGFYVINPDHLADVVRKTFSRLLQQGVPIRPKSVRRGLESAGRAEINFLTSLTGEMRPPYRAGTGARRAHPGHWADRKVHLVRKYKHEVTRLK